MLTMTNLSAAPTADDGYTRVYLSQRRAALGLPDKYPLTSHRWHDSVPITGHLIKWLDHFILPLGLPWKLEDGFDTPGTMIVTTPGRVTAPDGSRVRIPHVTITFNKSGYWHSGEVSYGRTITTTYRYQRLHNLSVLDMRPEGNGRRLTVDKIRHWFQQALHDDRYIPDDPTFRYDEQNTWLNYFQIPGVTRPDWVADSLHELQRSVERRSALARAKQQEEWDAEAQRLATEALLAAHEEEYSTLVRQFQTFVRLG